MCFQIGHPVCIFPFLEENLLNKQGLSFIKYIFMILFKIFTLFTLRVFQNRKPVLDYILIN